MEANRIYEKHIDSTKGMKLSSLITISKGICKIKTSQSVGTGFFVRIVVPYEPTKTKYKLVTTKKIIPISLLDAKETIEIITENEKIIQNIKLDIEERELLTFYSYNVVSIDILPKDKIRNKVKFLTFQYDYRFKDEESYINRNIIIIHYPNGPDLECNSGKIISEENTDFSHNLDTNKNSEGSPIFILDDSFMNPVIIGMQTGEATDNKYNAGLYLNKLIKILDGGKYYEFSPFLVIPENVDLNTMALPASISVHTPGLHVGSNKSLRSLGELYLGRMNENEQDIYDQYKE